MKKGQAALEFLLTYGWAILAILVAVGALSYYGGFFNGLLPNRCEVGPPFTCMEYKASSNGEILLGLQNVGDDAASINVTLYCNGEDTQPRYFSQAAVVPTQGMINNGLVPFNCTITGSQFRADIRIEYIFSGQSSTHVSEGVLRTAVD